MLFIFQWIAVPFTITNAHVTSILNTTDQWVGSLTPERTGENLDFAIFMVSKNIGLIIAMEF